MKELMEAAGKSLWKEIRDLALKKGTETFVAEGIKSIIEIAKRRRIRHDEFEFGEWKKAQNPDDEDDEKKSKSKDDKKAKPTDEDLDEPDNGKAEEKPADDADAETDKPAPPDDSEEE